MGKPFAKEVALFGSTLDWSQALDIQQLCESVRTAANLPLIAVGSGGSLTAAYFLTALHRHFTGQMSVASSPLEASAFRPNSRTSAWFLTAGGSNVDINSSFLTMLGNEISQQVVVCGRIGSRIAKVAADSNHVEVIELDLPAGKDGFLATNSLLAFCVLLARAYSSVFQVEWERLRFDALISDDALRQLVAPLWSRLTTIVLYGESTRHSAIDLESKFVESAIGNVQLSDYRNFGHGRHVWLAKHGAQTGVLALVDSNDTKIATKTLALIPPQVTTVRLDICGDYFQSSIGSLIDVMRIAGMAGTAKGIDPGKPGVPEFGRKLYNLKPQPISVKVRYPAIERKTQICERRLEQAGHLEQWRLAQKKFEECLTDGPIHAVVFDYDGTLVETRRRFSPPEARIFNEILRLMESGLVVGVATGRGGSVQRDLRATLPEAFWKRFVVGYYNGAVIRSLADDGPEEASSVCESLRGVAGALAAHPEIQKVASLRLCSQQITVFPKGIVPEGRLWMLVQQVVKDSAVHGVDVVRSTHSVDVLAPGVCKTNVIGYIQSMTAAGRDLRIIKVGDRGQWPGNDHSLLRLDLALSVDEVSTSMDSCWNLAPRGVRNTDATVFYCKRLVCQNGEVRWSKA